MKKNRWLAYVLIGLAFGVIDFYYQIPIQKVNNSLLLIFLALVIWIVVAVPVAIYETNVTRSAWKAGFAAAFTWAVAVVFYYLFMLIKLMFIGEPSRSEMNFSNRGVPYYWENVKYVLRYDVLGGMDEWLVVAIIGGFVIGFLIGVIYLKTRSPQLTTK